jgi:membrane-associated phospholipid phosphatase
MRRLPSAILSATMLAIVTAVRAEEEFSAPLRLEVGEISETEATPTRKDFLWPYRIEHGPAKYLEWLIKDPINLATRPFFWHSEQWRTAGIELAVTGALLPLDDPARDLVQDNQSQTAISITKRIRSFYTGEMLELYGVGLFASGLVLRNEKLADSGFLAAESVFYATQLSSVLKTLTKRERPKSANDQYEFNGLGGSTRNSSSSFVSGEVIGAFAFASSVSEVWQNPWVTWPLYGLAGAVAVHRLEKDAHWLSDVAAAAFLGHAFGKSIVRFHYRRDAEGLVVPFVTEDAVGMQVTLRF